VLIFLVECSKKPAKEFSTTTNFQFRIIFLSDVILCVKIKTADDKTKQVLEVKKFSYPLTIQFYSPYSIGMFIVIIVLIRFHNLNYCNHFPYLI
jgi:hypothetical protein